MSSKRLVLLSLLILGLVSAALMQPSTQSEEPGLKAGQNVNVVGGTEPETGDPYLQRQNEPTLAFSTRNIMNILVGMNDYRTIDIPFADELPGAVINTAKDAWLSYAQSNDGGISFRSDLLPGYPQDESVEGNASPIKGYGAAADPVVRAGTNGLFYMAGIALNRDLKNGNPVFVARFIDNNNKEFDSAIEYVDTNVWNTADSDVFFDKPWLEVDGPHGVGQRVEIAGQSIPEANVYLAYAAFRGVEMATKGYTGLKLDGTLTSQIYFQRSTDCGETWEPPVVFDSGHDINQGVSIAVDPRNNGQVVCAWRTFGGPYEAIMAAVSTNGGVDWDRVVEVAAFPPNPYGPFDQPTTPITFRTNAYPTVGIDQYGYIYCVWTQDGLGPNDEARLLIATSTDGLNWSAPMRVDNLADQTRPGNQFQPSLTIAAGKMLVAYVDQRYDVVQHYDYGMFDDQYIQETYPLRHTVDIRVSQALPSLTPVFSDSIQVSRYQWVYINGQATQLQYHTPGDRIYSKGTVPFIGDYLDIAPSPRFLPQGNGWIFNKDPNPATTFQVAWTDNRDVMGDLSGTVDYNPPGPGCINGDTTGIRNQNVYTSRISEGVIAGSPGNTKPLNIKRAFVVQAKNTTALEKMVRFEVDPNTAPYARFWEAGIEYDFLERAIPPYSAFATTVLVDPYGDEYAPVYINILEGGIIVSQVVLNPDPTNPEILDPYSEDPTSNPHIVNDEVHTPHIVNWTYEEVNPHIVNFDPTNPHIVNTDMVTPHIVNDDPTNPHIVNPHIVNPHIVNTAIGDVAEGSSGTDTIYTVVNEGNTTSSYSMGTYPADVPEGLLVQILVYKIYTTPTSQGCDLNQSEHHELLVNHTNPHIVNTSMGTAGQSIVNMLQENEDVWDVHFYLEPGEQAYIVYRTYNPDPLNIHFDDPLVPKLTSDIANVWDGNLGQLPAFPLLVVTTAVDAGIAGEPFSADIQAFGGTGPYIWELVNAPSGMTIDSEGIISWTSPIEGTHTFTVRITDQGDPQQVEEQSFTLTVVAKLEIYPITMNDGVIGQAYVDVSVSASGGSGNYTWSLDEAPGWMAIDPDFGTISGSDAPDEAGTFPVIVRVTDPGPPQQTATFETEVRIAQPPAITTESLPNGVKGRPYNAVVQAQNGLGDYTWELVWDPEDDIIDWIDIDPYTGMIYGTPSNFAGGVYITVRVTDGSYPNPLTATKSFSFTIYDELRITTTSENVGPAFVGTPYSVTFEATGGLQPFSWSLASDSGPLPNGLSFSTEGVLSGVPVYDPQATYPQDYPIKLHVKDAFVPWQEHTADFTITLHPKKETWAVFPQTPGDTEANAIAVDPEGNVYVVGKIIAGGLYSDLYIAKYDLDGQFGWEQIIDGGQGGNDEAEAIAVDSASDSTGIYVTGYITNANGNTDMFLIKLSRVNGQELWRRIIDGGYGDDKASAIAVKDGKVIITGFSTGKTSGEDYRTIVYSSEGVLQWNAEYDGPAHQGDFAKAIAISESGRVSITGASYRGNKNTGHLDYHTITYSRLGNKIWEARYDGKENGNDEALAICVDQNDNVYVTGRSELSKKKIKDYDYYTIKYDATGAAVWEERYDSGNGHEEASAIALDESGVYVTGYATGASSGADFYTVKYGLADGHVIHAARYDADSGEDKATGLAVDPSGVVVTGWSKPGGGTNFDIYTVKYTTALTEILWESWYDGNGSDDFAIAIVQSLAGDVYVTGISQSGLATTMVTLKY
jgi:hypothetical protein